MKNKNEIKYLEVAVALFAGLIALIAIGSAIWS